MCNCARGADGKVVLPALPVRERQEIDLLASATVKLGFTTWAAMETSIFFAGMDKRQVTTYLLTGAK